MTDKMNSISTKNETGNTNAALGAASRSRRLLSTVAGVGGGKSATTHTKASINYYYGRMGASGNKTSQAGTRKNRGYPS